MIKAHVRSTYRAGVIGDLGGFGGVFAPDWKSYRDPLLVSSTDGVGTKSAIAELGRGQRCQREQVGRGAGVDQERVALAGVACQVALEDPRLRPRGEPEVEAGAHQLDHLLWAEHAAGCRHARVLGIEGAGGMGGAGVLADEREDLIDGGRHRPAISALARRN